MTETKDMNRMLTSVGHAFLNGNYLSIIAFMYKQNVI